ncbi:MAG: acetylxylan esterase, partial [Candidatus Omnitrophica bacterium]|nr:acetylxylan esterase [Candidatus Omnitrophota bacterium]
MISATRGFLLVFLLWIQPISADSQPMRTSAYHPGDKEEAVEWQGNLREDLWRILQLQPLREIQGSLDLNPEKISSRKKDHYEFQAIEISSTPSRRIPVVVTLLESEGPHPAVVCIHGHGHDRFKSYDKESIYKGFASVLAERGVVTIAMDVGQHEVYEEGMILMGERLWDVIRCVDYLESLPQVDKGRIGCAGLSLGGEMAMWLGAMDTRIQATVSAGFLTTMDHMEVNHCMCWKFEGLRELVDYADIYSLIAPRALMCQNGLKEPESQFYVPLAR